MSLTTALLGVVLGQHVQDHPFPEIDDVRTLVVLNHPDERESLAVSVKGFDQRLALMQTEGYEVVPLRSEGVNVNGAYWAYRPGGNGLGYLRDLDSVFKAAMAGQELPDGAGYAFKLSDLTEGQLQALERKANLLTQTHRRDGYRVLQPEWEMVFEAPSGHEYRVPYVRSYSDMFKSLDPLPERTLDRVGDPYRARDVRPVLTRNAVNIVMFSRERLNPQIQSRIKVAGLAAYEEERHRVMTDFRNAYDSLLDQLGAETPFLDEIKRVAGRGFGELPKEIQSQILSQKDRVPEFKAMSHEEAWDKMATLRLKAVRAKVFLVSQGLGGRSYSAYGISRERG